MTWEKFDRSKTYAANHKRRERPCISRSQDRPDAAYLMLPKAMVGSDRVSIYTGKDGKIAFEFCIDGDYTVRPTSRTSYTFRITIPKALAQGLPFGLHDVDLDRNSDGWLILNPSSVGKEAV